jgi:hypothetical protein
MWKFVFRKMTLLTALISASSVAAAKTRMSLELPIPDENHAAITVERSLSGVFVDEDNAIIFSGTSPDMVKIPLNLEGKNREEKFGKLTDQKRVPLTDAKYPGKWRGVFTADERVIAWDASMLQLLLLRSKDFKTISSATVPADLLRPAADRGGEPTHKEIERSRNKFRDASKKIFGIKFTGVMEIPEKWEKGSGRNYVVSSRISEFPLMIMNCRGDDPGTCMITRSCFLEGGPKIQSSAVTGIAVMPESKEILIGNHERNEIDIYKFNSCFDVVWERTLKLPARLPKMSNLTVDPEQNLWVVTKIPDSFTDANLFYWEKEVWFGAR